MQNIGFSKMGTGHAWLMAHGSSSLYKMHRSVQTWSPRIQNKGSMLGEDSARSNMQVANS